MCSSRETQSTHSKDEDCLEHAHWCCDADIHHWDEDGTEAGSGAVWVAIPTTISFGGFSSYIIKYVEECHTYVPDDKAADKAEHGA